MSRNLAERITALCTGSVRRRLILGVILVHTLLMSFFILDTVERQHDFLHREALRQAESLASNLAASSVSGVLSSDLMGLAEITASVSRTPGLEYACLLDPAGRVLSHTRPALAGQYVSDSVSLSLLTAKPEPTRLVVNSRQVDVAAPIMAGSRLLGWARVGFSQRLQRENLMRLVENGVSYGVISVIVGGLLAYVMARRLSSGLERLVADVDAVRAGDRSVTADESGEDELARLGAGFNAMLRAVREGEVKFRTVADFTYDWEYWRGPDGVLVWVSPSCELCTGYTVSEFMKNPALLRAIVHADDHPLYDAHMHEVEGGSIEPGELDFRILHKNGQVVWIDHHCEDITRADGTLLGRRVSNRDITARKQAEEGLRRWARAFENAAWGIVICEPASFRIETMNAAFARMHDCEVQELAGRDIGAVFPEAERQALHENLRQAIREGHHTFEADHERKGGLRFPAQMDVTAVKDEHGHPLSLVLNVQDITDRRHAEDRLRAAVEEANAANQAKSDFLAVMSHELRTPLSGIKGMLTVLRDQELSPEERRIYLEHALGAGDNLALILNDVLDITRIEAGKMRLVEEPFSLEEVARPVCVGLENAAREKGLAISYAIDPALPAQLRGDAGRIRQVLLNLMGNAVKFTQSGQVSLEVYLLCGPAEMMAQGRLPVHFCVRDTGIGIAHNHLEAIFEPFTQLESPYTRSHGGAGLGLPIVKRLTALLGGRIDVYSEIDQGTEVHVTLPLQRADAAVEEPALVADERLMALTQLRREDGSPLLVLVAEDDLLNQFTALKYLEFMGCRGKAVSTGSEALEHLRTEGADIVLMDIQMPGMDGVETTRRIRADQTLNHGMQPAVLALTAHAMTGDEDAFLRVGMDGYLAKPYDPDSLKLAMKQALVARAAVRNS